MQFILKIVISDLIIAGVSELGKRYNPRCRYSSFTSSDLCVSIYLVVY